MTGRTRVTMPSRPRKATGTATDGLAPAGRELRQATATSTGPEDDPFDLWLRRSLREAFDAVAAEPIPEDVLRLIEEDHAARERIRRARAAKSRG
jgi:hypothetical protein